MGHVSAGTWSASENNPRFSWRGKTPCLVSRNTWVLSLQNLQEVVCTCLHICVSNFSQINRLLNSSFLISAITHVSVRNSALGWDKIQQKSCKWLRHYFFQKPIKWWNDEKIADEGLGIHKQSSWKGLGYSLSQKLKIRFVKCSVPR